MRSFLPIPTSARTAAGLLVAALLLAPVPGHASQPQVLSIAAARAMPLGSTVTVEGSVSVPSAIFSSGGSLDQGFAIEDRTGGIYVSIQTNLELTLGQRAQVTGQLVDFLGELLLVPASTSDVEVLGRGRRVEPLRLPTGQLGAANQGLLVRITGTITGDFEFDPPFGIEFSVDDGSGPARIFVNTSTGIDLSLLAEGQRISLTGLSSAFETPEIDPRFQSDIRVEGHD
jgi:hypothetical protein